MWLPILIATVGVAVALVMSYGGVVTVLICIGIFALCWGILRGLKDFEMAIIFLIVFIPVYPKFGISNIPGTYIPIRIDDVFIPIIVAFWVLHRRFRFEFWTLPIVPAWMIFEGVTLLSTLAGIVRGDVDLTRGMLYWGKGIEYLSLYIMFANHLKTHAKFVQRYAFWTIFGALIVVVYGVMEIQGIVPTYAAYQWKYYEELGRVVSLAGDQNQLAGYLMVVLLFSVALFQGITSKLHKIGLLAILPLLLFVFGATLSRSGFYGLSAGLIWYGFSKKTRFATILIFLVLLITLSPETVQERFLSLARAGKVTEDETALSRMYQAWPFALAHFWPHPILGSGASVLGETSDGWYARLLGESGMGGAATFMLLIGSIFVYSRRVAKRLKGLGGYFEAMPTAVQSILVGLCVHALGFDTFYASKIMPVFWTMVAFMFGLDCVARNAAFVPGLATSLGRSVAAGTRSLPVTGTGICY
jgi:hypothetical protein